MSSLTPIELVDFLTRNQILGHSHLEVVAREGGRFATSQEVLDDLLDRGWLTKFQHSQIASGQGEKLVLGPYRLIESIGEGGMGMVFKGWHPRLDRYVALKLIRPQVLASRPEIITRFHREARAIAQLHHPNIVLLYDADEVNGTHYIAMEFVDGATLEKLVRQNGPMAVKQACDYMRQSALGLQHAAECGLVHRDIKPTNILVAQKMGGGAGKRSSSQLRRPALVTVRDRDMAIENPGNGRIDNGWGTIKILDMGLARLQESLEEDASPATPLTRAGALLGTPDFISPEQARDARSVDIRADIYSLGCTFYYMLTGRPPFPGGNDVQKLIKHQTEKPYPLEELRPHIPSVVVGIVEKMMAKKVEGRYQSPQELANDLADYLASSMPHPTPPRGMLNTEPMFKLPSPVPFSPLHSDGEAPLAEILGGFDDSDEDVLPESPTAMVAKMPPSKEISPVAVIAAHTGVVSAVALSPDGNYAATGGVDGRIRLWDLSLSPPREAASLPRAHTEIQALTFAPDDPQYLVYGGTVQGHARLQRWDWTDSRVFEWGGFSTTDNRGVGCLNFSHDGTMFAAGVGSFAVTWKVNRRIASGRNILKGQGSPIRALAFSPDHRLLVTAGECRSIRFWGFGWLGSSLKATLQSHADRITSIAFSPDGKRLATVGLDRQVVLWDPLTPSDDTAIVLTGHTNNLRHVRFLPDGKHLLSIGESGQVILWDVTSTLVVREFALDLSLAYCLTLSQDCRKLLAGYSNGQFAVFNLQPNIAATVFPSPAPISARR